MMQKYLGFILILCMFGCKKNYTAESVICDLQHSDQSFVIYDVPSGDDAIILSKDEKNIFLNNLKNLFIKSSIKLLKETIPPPTTRPPGLVMLYAQKDTMNGALFLYISSSRIIMIRYFLSDDVYTWCSDDNINYKLPSYSMGNN